MTKRPKTFVSDLQWAKISVKRLHEAIEDEHKGKERAKKIVDFLDKNSELRRDLMGFYLKAKERLEEEN